MTQESSERREPSQRPSISQLREEVAAGKNVYTVIGSALIGDGQRMYRQAQNFLLSQANGTTTTSLDLEVIELYELQPALADVSELQLANNLGFVAGFNLVAAHLYPDIPRASKPTVRIDTSSSPQAQALLRNLSPQAQQEILENLGNNQAADMANLDQVKAAIEEDPTGATWLEEKIRQQVEQDSLEFIGAQKAILGAKKLFSLLKV